jgi:hypothetical protein
MDETQVVTTPPVEGSPEGTGSQAAVPTSQEAGQSQETGQAQVESREQSTSSQPSERPQASGFYQARKLEKQIRQLTEEISRLKQQPKQTTSEVKPPSAEDQMAEYFKNPVEFTKKQMQEMREVIRKELLEKELPEFIGRSESERENKRKEQEALELLFPKDSSKPNETLEERVRRDKVRTERIQQIIDEHGLNALDPKKGASLALMLYNQEVTARKPAPNPALPKKSQMGSTATGTPANGVGGNKTMTLQEIKAKNTQLDAALENDPSLKYSEKFIAEKAAVRLALTQRAEELSKQQQ